MNILEFNEKKQQLLNAVFDIDVGSDEIEEMINELQPPTMPTCSTCTGLAVNSLSNNANCALFRSPVCGVWIPRPKFQSCIHHSDYEVKE